MVGIIQEGSKYGLGIVPGNHAAFAIIPNSALLNDYLNSPTASAPGYNIIVIDPYYRKLYYNLLDWLNPGWKWSYYDVSLASQKVVVE